MSKAATILKYVIGALVVLVLGGVVGWFFYINYQTRTTNAVDAARGYGTSVPSFGNPAGSSQGNIAQSLGVGGESASSSPATPLWRVDATPVAGFGFVRDSASKVISGSGGTSTAPLYFAERANGNIFSADVDARAVARITNTLKTRTYEALFGPKGDIVERSIDANGTVTTFAGRVATTTARASIDNSSTSTPDALTGAFLAPDIKTIAINQGTGELTYTVENSAGGMDVVTQPWASAKKKTIFTSAIGSWNVTLLADGRTVLQESPADDVLGYAYTVSSAGALTTIARSLPGLSVAPDPGSTAILYSTSAAGTVSLFVQATSKSSPVQLPIHTIADKCVWLPSKSMIAYCAVPSTAPTGAFINNWYRGAVHTVDTWWQIDVSAGTAKLVYSPSSANATLDVENPQIDSSGNYIAFTNFLDDSLWIWHITQ